MLWLLGDPWFIFYTSFNRLNSIELAKKMRQLGSDKYNKDYHFVVQGVGISAEWPILGLNGYVSDTGELREANRTVEII